MARITLTTTIEPEVYEAARAAFDNLSGAVNELLKAAVVQKTPEAKELFDAVKAASDIKAQLSAVSQELESKKTALAVATAEVAAKEAEAKKKVVFV